jgi:serine/threonine-protein kinase
VQIALKQIREEPAPLPGDVPAEIRAVVERAMAKDPAVRYADGAALRDAAEAAAAYSPTVPVIGAEPAPTDVLPAQPAAPVRRNGPGRRTAARLLVGVVAAFAVVTALVVALAGAGADPASGGVTGPTTAPATPARPSTVDVVAGDLVGRPLDEVRAELVGRGLQVQASPVETGEVAAGLVTAVAPEGGLEPGTAVTLSYAVAPVVAPAPAPAPAGTGPGNGHGNGHGHGKRANG